MYQAYDHTHTHTRYFKKKSSIRRKLIFTFGLLILFAVSILGISGTIISKNALMEKVDLQLTQQAKDVAALIHERIDTFFLSVIQK